MFSNQSELTFSLSKILNNTLCNFFSLKLEYLGCFAISLSFPWEYNKDVFSSEKFYAQGLFSLLSIYFTLENDIIL